jgi:hypothetical protein
MRATPTPEDQTPFTVPADDTGGIALAEAPPKISVHEKI